MDTKALRNKILDLAIHGRLGPQDPNDEPASALLKRITPKAVTSSDNGHYGKLPFEVPSSWVWTRLGDICNYGICDNIAVDNIGDEEWVLELEDVEKDTAKIIQRQNKNEREISGIRRKFQKGDILYSKLRTYLNKVLIAPDDGYCSTEIVSFSAHDSSLNDYVCHVLRTQYFVDYTCKCGYGVKMPRLSTNDARKGLIPLPPLAEQRRIVKSIEHIFSKIDAISDSL